MRRPFATPITTSSKRSRNGTGVLEGILLPIRCECKKRADDERLNAIHEAEEERRREELRRIGLTSKAYAEKTFAADVAPESSLSKMCRRYCEQWSEMKKVNDGPVTIWIDSKNRE